MKRSRSIVGIAVGVSSVVLIVAGVIAHRSVQLLADTSDEILRSKELELSLERLLSSLRDAETGQRGYLVTGSESYLFPYDSALREIDGRLHTVEIRMAARKVPMERTKALHGLVQFKLEELARTKDMPRIFEMFAQVKPTLDRKDGGLGIGLALSRALVQMHGGTLDGRSEGAGKGSEFTVRLPLSAVPSA